MAEPIDGAVMVIAKTPEPGRAKTRLCPPLTPDEACRIAWACLYDTLAVVATVPARRRVVVLDGTPGPWIPADFEVIAQRGADLGERLDAAFTDVDDVAVVIAMDTPQVTATLLAEALLAVVEGREVASFGPAADGGFWLLGLPRSAIGRGAFDGVPMSVAQTGKRQLERLGALGLSTHRLPTLRDIDTYEDLSAVAAEMDGSATEIAWRRLQAAADLPRRARVGSERSPA